MYSDTHIIDEEMYLRLKDMMDASVEDFEVALNILRHADRKDEKTRMHANLLANRLFSDNAFMSYKAMSNMIEYQRKYDIIK